MCEECFDRCPHGCAGYDHWYCRCSVCDFSKRDRHKIWYEANKESKSTKEKAQHRKNPVKKMIQHAYERAIKYGIDFCLNPNDVLVPDKCPYLGIPLYVGNGTLGPNSPTIDRIWPHLGYIPSNVIVVSHLANRMKNTATPEMVVEMGQRMESLIKEDPRFTDPQGCSDV